MIKIKFIQDVSLKDSLIFDEEYPENLKFDLETKQGLKNDGCEFFYMVNAETNELIGETCFLPLDTMQDWGPEEEQLEDGLEPFYGRNAMYCYSNTILGKYQKQGYGKLLKAWFLGYAKAKRFDLIVSHARDNGSIKLNLSFGAEIIQSFNNWFQTGETVYLYTQKI